MDDSSLFIQVISETKFILLEIIETSFAVQTNKNKKVKNYFINFYDFIDIS